jgi:hypothetical protein
MPALLVVMSAQWAEGAVVNWQAALLLLVASQCLLNPFNCGREVVTQQREEVVT